MTAETIEMDNTEREPSLAEIAETESLAVELLGDDEFDDIFGEPYGEDRTVPFDDEDYDWDDLDPYDTEYDVP